MLQKLLHDAPPKAVGPTPRTDGKLVLSSKLANGCDCIDRFRTSGAMKALFPRGEGLQAIMINTSGGLTGGDKLRSEITAGEQSHLCLTTQAAERAYKSSSGVAKVRTTLTAQAGSTLQWLPQELILFDGAALDRRLDVKLASDARFLMVEPVVFGRVAMGERLKRLSLQDRIRVYRDGQPLFFDALSFDMGLTETLNCSSLFQQHGAFATVLYVSADAEAQLQPIRAALPQTAGASLIAPDTLVLRVLAKDSHLLRCTLLPILDRLSGDGLPTPWRL